VGRPHVSGFWSLIERRSIRAVDQVWTVSRPIAEHLASRYGIVTPVVQLNAPAVSQLKPNQFLRQQLGVEDTTPIVLHLGQLRPHRGAGLLIDALGDVPEAHLVFLGYGPEKPRLIAQATASNYSRRVHFLDPVPPAELPAIAAGADVGVTLLEPTCLNHRYALPNKLFDYLAAGLVVVGSDLPASSEVIRGYDCGLVVDPRNRAELSAALTRAIAQNPEAGRWRRNARAAAETLDWKTVSLHFVEQVKHLIGPARNTP
jgi:glycosyltransferase involved in cell wall biosynthesis